MARTKGSGWGGGVILYQICPKCGKKKAMFSPITYVPDFKCIWCKKRFNSTTLLRVTFREVINES